MRQQQSAERQIKQQTKNHEWEKKNNGLPVLTRGWLNEKPNGKRRSASRRRRGLVGLDEEGDSFRRTTILSRTWILRWTASNPEILTPCSRAWRLTASARQRAAIHNGHSRPCLQWIRAFDIASTQFSIHSCSCHLHRQHSNHPILGCGRLHRQCFTIRCWWIFSFLLQRSVSMHLKATVMRGRSSNELAPVVVPRRFIQELLLRDDSHHIALFNTVP